MEKNIWKIHVSLAWYMFHIIVGILLYVSFIYENNTKLQFIPYVIYNSCVDLMEIRSQGGKGK